MVFEIDAEEILGAVLVGVGAAIGWLIGGGRLRRLTAREAEALAVLSEEAEEPDSETPPPADITTRKGTKHHA